MDETKELFRKIRSRDKDSFHILTDTYGWKLYSYIRKKETNREAADRLFSDTLAKFHDNVEAYSCEDPIEAMLCLYADELSRQGTAQTNSMPYPCPPQAPVSPAYPGARQPVPPAACAFPQPGSAAMPKQKKSHSAGSFFANFFYGLCIIVLVVGIAAALWFLLGILVDMGVLPASWDLGYSWFNENVANWF